MNCILQLAVVALVLLSSPTTTAAAPDTNTMARHSGSPAFTVGGDPAGGGGITTTKPDVALGNQTTPSTGARGGGDPLMAKPTSSTPTPSTDSPATDRPRDPLELPADCNPADMPDNSIFGGRPLRPGEVIRCGSATWTGPPTELPKTSATGSASNQPQGANNQTKDPQVGTGGVNATGGVLRNGAAGQGHLGEWTLVRTLVLVYAWL